ncbi:capsule biosynthesis protein [Poseidonocella sedimentorum]|uniref:Capsular polysaccharide export protein n=1 Tax=Poseidonocella sedimentorum TaxID=871652 RepID=A0A1I6CU54_9RHOB|nr:capsule biosynthesis protein CapA [Poseidonocella sedimentorum]SFQ96774.1 capsular polysaccharide export protein [Poseidonocella sedimentorum]
MMRVDEPPPERVYLFLQGPHGPFFHQLGRLLRASGAAVWRVGFNAGDRVFWPDRQSYIAYRGAPEDWPARLDALITELGVTDIVLYGEARALHARAIQRARARGLRTHLLEEGYLRPFWITYERGGTNGNSASRGIAFDPPPEGRLSDDPHAAPPGIPHASHLGVPPPAHWGDLRQHIFYGALYNGIVMCLGAAYPRYRPHRDLPIRAEFALYLRRLLTLPLTAARRRRATRRIRRAPNPYHVALLQLEHDSAFRAHSSLRSMTEFIEIVIRGFAEGAPPHHHLVFKAHPLEDGRAPLAETIRAAARAAGLSARVHYLPGGKLAALLDEASSAVTVNSTAGQQVLWRGKPLKLFGAAIYDSPAFTSRQPLADFFANPMPPDRDAYLAFREHLLATSQIPGGFYSRAGRRRLLRRLVDLIAAETGSGALARPADMRAQTTVPSDRQLG